LFWGYTHYELAILCVAKILLRTDYGYKYVEGYVAQSEFSSPMYIYITIGGSTVGGMPWVVKEFRQARRNRSSIVALFR